MSTITSDSPPSPHDYPSGIWEAAKWLRIGGQTPADTLADSDLTVDATDAEIKALAAWHVDDAADEGAHILGGTAAVEAALRDLIERVREEEA